MVFPKGWRDRDFRTSRPAGDDAVGRSAQSIPSFMPSTAPIYAGLISARSSRTTRRRGSRRGARPPTKRTRRPRRLIGPKGPTAPAGSTASRRTRTEVPHRVVGQNVDDEGHGGQEGRLDDCCLSGTPRGRRGLVATPYAPQRRRDFLPPFFFARRSPRLPATSPV